MSSLLKSRKFLLVLIDGLVALSGLSVGYFVGDPDLSAFLLAVIASLQPVFVAAVVGIAVEDSAALKAGTHPSQE